MSDSPIIQVLREDTVRLIENFDKPVAQSSVIEVKRDTEKESTDAERLELIKAMREEGKSCREIAEILDISKSTIHRIISA